MARYPRAIWKPVERYKPGGSSHQAMPNPGRLCYHTAVTSGDSLFALFNTPGNAVAHFYVREDGRCEQYVDTRAQASANLEGNHDTISVESWDDGGRRRTWTSAQAEACAELAAWANKVHRIPLKRLPSSRRGTQGVGWHRLGIDGNFPQRPGELLGGRVPGGEHWSTSFGKVCPFDGKILGIVNDILPRARRIAEGDWFEMATKAELADVVENKVAPLRRELAEYRRNEVARDAEARREFAEYRRNEAARDAKATKEFAEFRRNSFRREQLLISLIRAQAERLGDTATIQQLNQVQAELEAAIRETGTATETS
jgi:N-acetylmuramoyl-L-alanine amidase-like protein